MRAPLRSLSRARLLTAVLHLQNSHLLNTELGQGPPNRTYIGVIRGPTVTPGSNARLLTQNLQGQGPGTGVFKQAHQVTEVWKPLDRTP